MGVENPLPKLAPLQRKRSMSHPGPRGLKKQQELPAKQQSLTIAQLQEKIDELETKQKSLANAKASRRDRMEVALQIHQYKVALQEIPMPGPPETPHPDLMAPMPGPPQHPHPDTLKANVKQANQRGEKIDSVSGKSKTVRDNAKKLLGMAKQLNKKSW